jgi:NAD(P)-dependent dehydrogenase (short-subunit alcohol dehydrogenase family)
MKKTVLITGGNRGLGLETARQLSERGFHVFLGSRDPERGKAALSKLPPGSAEVLALDITSEQSIRDAVAQLPSLDVLINNAGIYDQEDKSILELSVSRLLHTLETNTFGPLRVAQACWKLLEKSPAGGRIINVSSGLGQLSEMGHETPAYCISKTTLNAVTRQLSGAGRASNIAVNSVCPGWVRTDMGGPNAHRSVEEGVETIVWLAGDAPQDLTGQFLRDRKPIAW